MRIQVHIPGLDRVAKALEDIRDMMKENADAATVAAIDNVDVGLKTRTDALKTAVDAASGPQPSER